MKVASTVIMCAPCSALGHYRVLTVQRQNKARFMPNSFVFPGGVVEDADHDHCTQAAPIAKGNIALASKYAALREMYEETGILVTPDNYEMVPSPAVAARRPFYDVVKATEGMFPLPVYRLLTYARWITPEQEKYRYDTMFYVCVLKDEPKEIALQESEVVKAVWVTPSDAMAYHHTPEKNYRLPPPTFITMMELDRHKTIDELVKSFGNTRFMNPATGAEEVEARQPILQRQEDGSTHVILPGDAEHWTGKSPAHRHRLVWEKGGRYVFESNL